MDEQIEFKNLRYTFTPAELLVMAQDMAHLSQDTRVQEENKRVVMSDFTSKINALKEKVNNLSDKISAGFEIREFKCIVKYHFPVKDQKTYIRETDGEIFIEPMLGADYTLFNQWQADHPETEEQTETEEAEEQTETEVQKEFEFPTDLPADPVGEESGEDE